MYDNWEELENSIVNCKSANFVLEEEILYLEKVIKSGFNVYR